MAIIDTEKLRQRLLPTGADVPHENVDAVDIPGPSPLGWSTGDTHYGLKVLHEVEALDALLAAA